MNIFKILVLLLSISHASAKAETLDIKAEVMSAFNRLVLSANSLDSDAYFQHFDEEKFIGLNSDGSNWNSIDELKPLIEGGFNAIEKIDSLEFTNIRISVIDRYTAVLVNEFEQTMTLKVGTVVDLAGGGTQVWSKHSGTWKLVSVSASNTNRHQ